MHYTPSIRKSGSLRQDPPWLSSLACPALARTMSMSSGSLKSGRCHTAAYRAGARQWMLQTRPVCPCHRLAYSRAKMLMVQLGKPSAFRCCRLGFSFRTERETRSCLSLHGRKNKVENLLTGALPVWIQPECDSALGIAVSTTAEALEAAFAEAAIRQLKVGAVLVVSPTYFGTCSDIAGPLFISRSPFVCPSLAILLPVHQQQALLLLRDALLLCIRTTH